MSDRPQPLRIAISTGEPAGVGPELTARALADAAKRWPDARFTVLGDASLIAARAAADGLDWTPMTAAGGGAHVADAHVA
ncbi:4-hydroxythreonine-4-phosphate dehydrogenase, partial [Burkholderia pseudomallei]